MKQQYSLLIELLHELPDQKTARSSSQLNVILQKFIRILDYINGCSDELKRATSVYYSDISSIRDNIQQSLYTTEFSDKDHSFIAARVELKNNIEALATLIQPQEDLVEA